MSHSWKTRKHLYTAYTKAERNEVPLKNGRIYYIKEHKFYYRYRSVHRAFAACAYERHEDMTPGIRPRILPHDPWEDERKYRTAFLKPLQHSRVERHRAARKAAVREMDAACYAHSARRADFDF